MPISLQWSEEFKSPLIECWFGVFFSFSISRKRCLFSSSFFLISLPFWGKNNAKHFCTLFNWESTPNVYALQTHMCMSIWLVWKFPNIWKSFTSLMWIVFRLNVYKEFVNRTDDCKKYELKLVQTSSFNQYMEYWKAILQHKNYFEGYGGK